MDESIKSAPKHFRATHDITVEYLDHTVGHVPVMLCEDGQAICLDEWAWNAKSSAWRCDGGRWSYRGAEAPSGAATVTFQERAGEEDDPS